MKNSTVSQKRKLSTRGFILVGQEHLESTVKPNTTLSSASGKANSPVQAVSERFPALEKQEVIFTISAPGAREVTVAGNFNGWRTDATPLKKMGGGKWAVPVMLRSGEYEYRFIVDGQWCEDPDATQRAANPYGGFNSVLIVPLAVKTSIL